MHFGKPQSDFTRPPSSWHMGMDMLLLFCMQAAVRVVVHCVAVPVTEYPSAECEYAILAIAGFPTQFEASVVQSQADSHVFLELSVVIN